MTCNKFAFGILGGQLGLRFDPPDKG